MFEEFLQKSHKLAAELQALRCNKGTIVGIMSENRLEYPIVILGTMLTGAILTCFNPAYTVGKYYAFLYRHSTGYLIPLVLIYHK